jgi:hypothetical protein
MSLKQEISKENLQSDNAEGVSQTASHSIKGGPHVC